MTERALAEVKILDLTHYIAGPYCTRILAGFGADVLKIEKPDRGDPARHIGPFLNDEPGLERSGLFLYLNSNKKSVTLNLKTGTGVKIFKELLKDADVVIESFRPGVMGRLGLGYQTLKEINPRLLMSSISNFGQTGPYRDYKTSHLITWGMGVGIYTGDGYGHRPLQIGGWLTHYITGLFAAAGTITLIYHRNETGIGQHVDISMMESIMAMSTQPATVYDYTGMVHHDIGGKGFGVLQCKDGGYLGPSVWTLPQRERMFTLLGVPELIEDPRFQDNNFIANRDLLRDIIAGKLEEWDSEELFQAAVEWGIPFALVPNTRQVLESTQHKERGFLEKIEHSVMGEVTMPGAPFKMTETPWQTTSPAPLLGQHNEEIYCQYLGYSREDVVRLREQAVI